MINKIIKEQPRSIVSITKQIIVMLGCFYFCTALVNCSRHLHKNPNNLKKDSLTNKNAYGTNDALISKDYNDLDKFWCTFKEAMQGSKTAMDCLAARGKYIDATAAHKEEAGSVKISIPKNSQEKIPLSLAYTRKKTLLHSKDEQTEAITLMVANTGANAYKEATNSDALPAYQEVTESTFIAFMKQLIQYKLDLNSYNRYGETLLTEIITHGTHQNQIALLTLLLKAGASPDGLNHKQKSPLALINRIKKVENRKKVIKLLIEYGGNPLLAPTDKATQEYIREIVIGQLKKVNVTLSSPTCKQALTQADAKLPSFFNQKYNSADAVLSAQKDSTCLVCTKQEATPTTIKIPSCGHYVHGSCLAQSLINSKSKGAIKWLPRPSYIYTHLCPYCKKDIPQTFIKDLNQFYEGIKFEHMAFTIALRLAFAIPCVTVIPGGFVLAAGLLYPS